MAITPTRFAITTLVVALVWQAAPGADGDPADEPDHASRSTEVVAIAPNRLLPTVLVVPSDLAFGWLNYSSTDATITFEEDITAKLTCRSPGPFHARGAHQTAPRVASGGFVTLCSLTPGEYDYRVGLEGRDQPLLGKLVVQADH